MITKAQKRAFLPSVRITESWLSWFVRNTTFAVHVCRWRDQFSWRRSVRDLPHPLRSDFLLLRHCHLACHHPRPVCHLLLPITLMDTHTHPFNGPLSGTTRLSRYQKGKTNMDFTEARDSEWQWHQLGHMQVCTSLQTDNYASTAPLSFLQAGCPSCRPTNSVDGPDREVGLVRWR